MTTTVGVIGVGNMGSGLVKGWLRAASDRSTQGTVPKIIIWDKVEATVQPLLAEADGRADGAVDSGPSLSAAISLEALAEAADVILVVVKPKDAREVLGDLGRMVREDQSVVSAMAGLKLESLRAALGPRASLHRIMPNLGVEVGAGVVVMASEPGSSPEDSERVLRLLRPLGLVEPIPEELFDAVTAVSGSGPAFMALAIEGLEDGAVAAGMTRPEARRLVRQAALRVAEELGESAESPAKTRRHLLAQGELDPEVTELLSEREVSLAFRQAFEAAVERSRQMAKS